jgi:hypothetical protein
VAITLGSNCQSQLAGSHFSAAEFSLLGLIEVQGICILLLNKRNLKRIETIRHNLLQHAMVSVLGRTQESSGGDGGHVKRVILRC